jgi:hypothetical protein
MNVLKKPYELLVRWDLNGKLIGAHVQWSTILTDDSGALIGSYPGNVEPVAVTPDQQGFPLADILGQTHIDALTALTAEQQKSAVLQELVSVVNSQLAATEQQLQTMQETTGAQLGEAFYGA